MNPLRLLVVDDHPMVRRGLLEVFDAAADIEVVAAVADGESAIALAAAEPVDVVLMDVSMPGMDGVEATRRVLAVNPAARVVMLTSFAGHESVVAALDAGAIGYLLKDADGDELVRAVRAAAVGDSPLSPHAARAVIAVRRERHPADEMTTREREVLVLVSAGLANKQIAWRLGISEKTVKSHLTRVFQRIGVADRTQAALWAQRNNVS